MGVWRARVVVHPLTIAAVVMLALNDHVLKAWWPGPLTGKLSDVAGVWMVAAVAMAALGSARWGVALTALGFVLLKLVPSVAVLAAPVLGGVTRRDPADLVALTVLLPLSRLARRLGAQRTVPANSGWRTVGVAAVVTAAVFATTATSDDGADEVDAVALTTDGRPAARLSGEWWVFSGDRAVGVVAESAIAEDKSSCLDEVCFELDAAGVTADGLRVFEWTDDQREQIEWREGEQRASGTFLDLVTRATADGGEVWVALGPQGVLMRRGDGTWHRLAVSTAMPYEFDDSAWHQHLWLLPWGLLIVVPGALLLVRRRYGLPSVGVAIAAHACNLAVALGALVQRPSGSLLSSEELPPDFGRTVFWWTLAAQLPWMMMVVAAVGDRHANRSPAVDQGE